MEGDGTDARSRPDHDQESTVRRDPLLWLALLLVVPFAVVIAVMVLSAGG